jgi:hypothetical protein
MVLEPKCIPRAGVIEGHELKNDWSVNKMAKVIDHGSWNDLDPDTLGGWTVTFGPLLGNPSLMRSKATPPSESVPEQGSNPTTATPASTTTEEAKA